MELIVKGIKCFCYAAGIFVAIGLVVGIIGHFAPEEEKFVMVNPLEPKVEPPQSLGYRSTLPNAQAQSRAYRTKYQSVPWSGYAPYDCTEGRGGKQCNSGVWYLPREIDVFSELVGTAKPVMRLHVLSPRELRNEVFYCGNDRAHVLRSDAVPDINGKKAYVYEMTSYTGSVWDCMISGFSMEEDRSPFNLDTSRLHKSYLKLKFG